MIPGWIVIREEPHVEDRFWICLKKEDALAIADDVIQYWEGQSEPEGVDVTLYRADQVLRFHAYGRFCVTVLAQSVREAEERDKAATSE